MIQTPTSTLLLDPEDDTPPTPAELECCWHIGSTIFGIATPQDQPGQASIRGMLKTCCWHGHVRMHYAGVSELGHGSFVVYETPPGHGTLLLPSGVQIKRS